MNYTIPTSFQQSVQTDYSQPFYMPIWMLCKAKFWYFSQYERTSTWDSAIVRTMGRIIGCITTFRSSAQSGGRTCMKLLFRKVSMHDNCCNIKAWMVRQLSEQKLAQFKSECDYQAYFKIYNQTDRFQLQVRLDY